MSVLGMKKLATEDRAGLKALSQMVEQKRRNATTTKKESAP